MESNDPTGHIIGILLVLAMLAYAAALTARDATEAEPPAIESNAYLSP